MDFDLDESFDKEILKKNYHQQILNLFRPYVNNKFLPRYKNREQSDFRG